MCAMIADPPRRLTADDLAAMPDDANYELVDGELEERAMGNESSWVGLLIASRLVDHCLANRLGLVFGADGGYRCFADDPNRVRRPDVSFVGAGRLPGDRPPKGYATIAPDLAVEVISPGDLAWKLDQKIEQYLQAGVRLVWVINPETRTARVHRADRTIAGLSGDDNLSGEDVIPGFRCRLSALFPAPAGPGVTSASSQENAGPDH